MSDADYGDNGYGEVQREMNLTEYVEKLGHHSLPYKELLKLFDNLSDLQEFKLRNSPNHREAVMAERKKLKKTNMLDSMKQSFERWKESLG